MICPICNSKYEQFNTIRNRINALCPNCGSRERHRLIWLYLTQKTNFLRDKLRVLHCSPTTCLSDRFRKLKNIEYISINTNPDSLDIDLQKTSFCSNLFDVVIVSHVLEHIKDDNRALCEIFRILKSGGNALLLVPIRGERTEIIKEGTKNVTIGTIRTYGTDFKNQIERVGFEVKVIDGFNYGSEYGLCPDDFIYVAIKK